MKKDTKNTKVKKGMSKIKMLAIGAGVAAVGAGAYYLLGKNSKEHQKKVALLALKMKKEVESEIKKVEEVTMPMYHKAVDAISLNYVKQYKMHEGDIKNLARKLKSEWKGVKNKVKLTSIPKNKKA